MRLKLKNKILINEPNEMFKLGIHFKNVIGIYEKPDAGSKKEPVKEIPKEPVK